MANMSAQEFTEKWGKRLKASTTEIAAGVDRVTEAPGQAAARKQEKMLTNLTESVQNGTWAERVASVSTDEWRTKMKNKGIQRISAGVDGSKSKMEEFARVLLPHAQAVSDEVKRMPDLTIEDSINRSATAIRKMSELKFRRK